MSVVQMKATCCGEIRSQQTGLQLSGLDSGVWRAFHQKEGNGLPTAVTGLKWDH